MKVDKKTKKEVTTLMQDYWDSYFKGDLDHWANYLVDNYRNIGGTEEELWNSKQEILDYSYKMQDQLTGTAKIKNKTLDLIPYDPYLMVHEFMDIFIIVEGEWKFYQKFRLSSLIQNIDNEWKVLHQHGSYPDAKTGEGEAFAFDEIKAENKKLKDAVQRRTIELEDKNRELEIEGALEKVRSRSLAMHNTSELQEVIHTVHEELLNLNIAINGGSFIAINSDIETTLRCWGSGGTADTTEEIEIPLYKKRFCSNLIRSIKKGPGFFTESFTQKEKKDFFTFLFKHDPWKKLNVKEKKETLLSPGGYTRSCYVSDHTSIFIINHFGENFSAADNDILQRFGKVFEQAYTRFLDLQKAEAQTREVQIEISLEKIRNHSMLMQHSNEIQNLSLIFHEQLLELKIPSEFSYIWLPNESKAEHMFWATWTQQTKNSISTESKAIIYPLDKKEKYTAACFKAWKSKTPVHIHKIPANETESFFNTWKELLKGATKLKARYFKDGLFYAESYMKYGCFGINVRRTLTPEEQDILFRFTIEFERAYTRFLDLQKAEASAREAQIEAALEKVRSTSLAMHKSNELKDVVLEVLKKLQDLGIAMENRATAIFTYEKESKDYYQWVASPEYNSIISFLTPYIDHPVQNDIWNARQNGTDFYAKSYTVQEKNTLFKYFFELPALKSMPQKEKKKALAFKYYDVAIAFEKNSAIILVSHSGTPLTEGENAILKRFAKVFEQSYTRFLDLQKAEASAREAQIEAALEKVRSRSLAMHTSNELNDVVSILFEKIKELQIPATAVGITIKIEDSKDLNAFVCSENNDGLVMTNYRAPYFNNKIFKDQSNALEQQLGFFVGRYSKKEKDAFYEYMIEHTEEFKHLPEDIKHMIFESQSYTITMVAVKNAVFNINDFEGKVLAEKDVDIIKRFAKVFDQAYTRFLDLQKAEAQVREAQIEASLERVRSRSLAMHTSAELGEIITVVLNNLQELGYIIDEGAAAHLAIFSEDTKDFVQWSADPKLSSPVRSFIPYTDLPILTDFLDAKQQGLDFFAKIYPFDEKNTWFSYAFQHSDLKHLHRNLKHILLQSETYAHSIAFQKNSAIIINSITGNRLSENQIDILKRFSKVFEQAYTRFLDLEKAEAQAREVEIELALERVRARTMAMQHSEELLEVATVLFQQVKGLGVPQWNCGFNIWEPGDEAFTYYPGSPDGVISPSPCKIPLNDHPVFRRFDESRKKGIELLVYEKEGEEQKDHYQYMLSLAGVGDLLQSMMDAGFELPTFQIDHIANFAYGNLIFITYEHFPEMHQVFKRFAKVFEQTYTRFLDLQKAEESAREAQIEAALEKVRSRSLAMHKSDELNEVVTALFEKLKELGIPATAAAINIFVEESNDMIAYVCGENENRLVLSQYRLPYFDNTIAKDLLNAHKNKLDFFIGNYSKKETKSFYKNVFVLPELQDMPKDVKQMILQSENYTISMALAKNSNLTINDFKGNQLSQIEIDIVKRFAKVFDQAYTRFLDLQKAEEQAREGQIELGLERVRAGAMAMQDTDELKEVIRTVYAELTKLNLSLDRSLLWIMNEEDNSTKLWMAGAEGIPVSFYVPYHEHPPYLAVVKGWKERNPNWQYDLGGQIKKDWDKFVFSKTDMQYLPGPVKEKMQASEGNIMAGAFQKFGCLQTSGPVPLTKEQYEVLNRFAKVFDSTYTRFNDLQKAEASAREATIEASLERVRSRSMAMHKSDEMLAVIEVVSEQLQLLNLNFDTVSFAKNNQEGDFTFWITSKGQPKPLYMEVPTMDSPVLSRVYEAKKNGVDFFADVFTAEENREWTEHLIKYSDLKYFPESIKEFILNAPGFARSSFLLKNIDLYVGNYRAIPFTEEENAIFKRFAQVFEQAYTRFLDLQKAEASAREAIIEASLERVRSRSMAMHKADELREAGDLLCTEIQKLGIETITSGYVIMDDEENIGWNYAPNPHTGKIMEVAVGVPHSDTEIMRSVKAAWKKQEPVFVVEMNEAETIAHQTFIAEKGINFPISAEMLIAASPPKLKLHNFNFKEGYLIIVGGTRLTDEQEGMMLRFTKVFQQTYRRFLDLQRAEAQAKEATIEAALEKVRSRSLAMHTANELSEVVTVIVEKLTELGVVLDANGVILCTYFPDSKNVLHWIVSPDYSMAGSYLLPYFDHPIFNDAWNSKMAGDEYFSKAFSVEQKNSFFEYAFEHSDYRNFPDEFKQWIFQNDKHILSFAWQKNSAILIPSHTGVVPTETEKQILIRFSKVFEQAYVRFMDLKKAEAQTREAQIEAGLEKVRSRTLAMQKSDELADTSIVIFEQLINLGIEPNRLFIGIVNDETAAIDAWATNEDGTKIGNHFTLNTDRNKSVKKMYEGWKQKKTSLTIDMTGPELESYFHYLADEMKIPFKGGLSQKRRVQTIAYFGQGLIGMASPDEQPESTTHLLERFAAVFNLTYTRFNDLKIAEAHALKAEEDLVKLQTEKQRAEDALTNLQAAQKQLVQSEKMASLGELTAGIAHEIQNPLNFVNNFSEVSKELLDEMNDELEKGNLDDVRDIMKDVIQNLEKINHHGKRADAIVKGMLQHSQSSTGKKEPTDINVLADEYLRLAYHGLRAKDKSFNATMKTEFDLGLEKVNIIPQDIGRVILNLITNAFYAVNEKKNEQTLRHAPSDDQHESKARQAELPEKSGQVYEAGLVKEDGITQSLPKGYEPAVSISTKKMGNKVEISVTDNGNGIPKAVKDKIFQPFFTTKPTGQGTGLGLSLSYDIVKAHGGEIKVETEQNKGTAFIITLSI